jgi:invasion protein IalB
LARIDLLGVAVVHVFGVRRPLGRVLAVAGFLAVIAIGTVAAPPSWAATAAVAQDAAVGQPIKVGTTANDNPQPWTVNCTSQPTTGELVCSMTQVLIAQNTSQRVVGASVFRPQPSAAAVMRLSLPHGILLQKGADVWIDESAPTNHPIIIADQNGSYSDVELGGTMLVALQGGDFLHIGVTAGTGERVEFQLSLKGFTAAFAKL